MFGLATPPELMAAAQLLVAMCGKMPALRSELLVIFGAIDRGEGVDIGGIADAGLRDRLRAVFETLKLEERADGFAVPKQCSATEFAPTFGSLLKESAAGADDVAPTPEPASVPQPTPAPSRRTVGPAMRPANWTAPSPAEDDEASSSDDGAVGPQLPHLARKPTNAALKEQAAAVAAMKAEQDNEWRRMKGLPPKGAAPSASKGTKRQRDSWMTSLPTGRTDAAALASSAALGGYKKKTAFSGRKAASAEPDSAWTMAPEEARKREREKAAAELLGLELESNRPGPIGPAMRPGGAGGAPSASLGMAPRNDRADAAARAAIGAFNAQHRNESLVDKHQAKKKKKSMKRGIGSWDRDAAMAFGQGKAKGANAVNGAVRDASELYSRFSGAEHSRTFL